MSRSADTSDIANIKKAKPETNHKKALHFGVLIGLVVLVFGLDQLLFGTLGSFQTTSLKEFFGSAADLFVGAVLALAALQAYLWQSKSPRAPDGAKTAGGASSRGDLLKAAQVSLNRDLDRAFQKGGWLDCSFFLEGGWQRLKVWCAISSLGKGTQLTPLKTFLPRCLSPRLWDQKVSALAAEVRDGVGLARCP